MPLVPIQCRYQSVESERRKPEQANTLEQKLQGGAEAEGREARRGSQDRAQGEALEDGDRDGPLRDKHPVEAEASECCTYRYSPFSMLGELTECFLYEGPVPGLLRVA